MKMKRIFSSGLVTLVLTVSSAFAQQLALHRIASNLDTPLGFVQNPSMANVQHVVLKGGKIVTLQNHALIGDFLDISDRVKNEGESGLLGLAFAPDYATSGRLYVNYINLAGNTVIARFQRSDPYHADAASEFDLVWPDGNNFIFQPADGHRGGNLAFGPDGMLYIGLGDGDSLGGDPEGNAQNPGTFLGKMLRINVSVDDANGYVVPDDNPFVGQEGVLPEIWAFGLRNPWRWSFDPATNALVIGDVGQGMWEEIDYQPAGRGGVNYGWPVREGANDFDLSRPAFGGLTEPIFNYSHIVGDAVVGASITGGVVYRGSALGPAYVGRYFFADWVQARVWSLGLNVDPATGEASAGNLIDHTEIDADAVASFGVDASGEMYVVSTLGDVFQIIVAAAPPPAPVQPPPQTPPNDIPCEGSDPFASLGGGTCYNGGWLPPGVVPPNAPTPAPRAPPSPQPVVPLRRRQSRRRRRRRPVGGDGTCSTPDPFASIGGGTCSNGGWRPGVAAPTPPAPPTPVPPAPNPSPTPVTPPGEPAPAPAPPAVPCLTPDPFVSLGGGTCYNGGWWPPGILLPTPTPAPPSQPSPLPTGGCITPDPFVSLGGGRCVNGGWLPPGIGGH